jgi:hypothetical protein
MRGAIILRNQENVEIRDFAKPIPGHGQVVLKVMASSICGSDLRAIYRKDAEAADPAEEYKVVICGHCARRRHRRDRGRRQKTPKPRLPRNNPRSGVRLV